MGTSVQVMPLCGVYNENPLSYLVSIDGFNFLIDCGWNDHFDPSLLQPLSRSLPLLLLSFHFISVSFSIFKNPNTLLFQGSFDDRCSIVVAFRYASPRRITLCHETARPLGSSVFYWASLPIRSSNYVWSVSLSKGKYIFFLSKEFLFRLILILFPILTCFVTALAGCFGVRFVYFGWYWLCFSEFYQANLLSESSSFGFVYQLAFRVIKILPKKKKTYESALSNRKRRGDCDCSSCGRTSLRRYCLEDNQGWWGCSICCWLQSP